MKLEFRDGVIALSKEIVSYFDVLKNLFEDDEKAILPLEFASIETFVSLTRWLHGEEITIDDATIDLVLFLNMTEPHKTRFYAEIANYLLDEPRLLPFDIYTNLLRIDPERVILFV